MRNAFVAEWLVARWTDKQRAASMVGDLVELQSQKGPLWFWLSVARIVVSLAWRPVLGWLAACCVSFQVFTWFAIAARDIHAQHPFLHSPSESILQWMAHAGVFFWVTLIYAAIRYGPRDRVTRLSLALSCSVAGVIYLWWQPLALAVCILVGAAAVLVSLMRRAYRGAGAVVAVTVTCGFAGGALCLSLMAAYLSLLSPWAHGKEFRDGPMMWMLCGILALMAMLVWFMTAACSRMHRWLLPNEQTGIALD